MKKLILLLALIVTGIANAQPPTYDDLRILYADGNYEKLAKVADKYCNNDKTKNDPLVHMWLGKALYKISLVGSEDENFKNAFKDAIGSVGKSIKLDKEGTCQSENEEFYNEFKNSMVEMISNEMANPKKASSWVLKYYKISPNSIGAKYLEGACKYLDADKGGANTAWKDADAKLAKVTDFESWPKAEKDLLKMGVIATADCYVKGRQVEKAKALLGKVAQWFENDEDFKAKYEEIVN